MKRKKMAPGGQLIKNYMKTDEGVANAVSGLAPLAVDALNGNGMSGSTIGGGVGTVLGLASSFLGVPPQVGMAVGNALGSTVGDVIQDQVNIKKSRKQVLATKQNNIIDNPYGVETLMALGGATGNTVEVEGNETIMRPNGELAEYSGASHAQGGIPYSPKYKKEYVFSKLLGTADESKKIQRRYNYSQDAITQDTKKFEMDKLKEINEERKSNFNTAFDKLAFGGDPSGDPIKRVLKITPFEQDPYFMDDSNIPNIDPTILAFNESERVSNNPPNQKEPLDFSKYFEDASLEKSMKAAALIGKGIRANQKAEIEPLIQNPYAENARQGMRQKLSSKAVESMFRDNLRAGMENTSNSRSTAVRNALNANLQSGYNSQLAQTKMSIDQANAQMMMQASQFDNAVGEQIANRRQQNYTANMQNRANASNMKDAYLTELSRAGTAINDYKFQKQAYEFQQKQLQFQNEMIMKQYEDLGIRKEIKAVQDALEALSKSQNPKQ